MSKDDVPMKSTEVTSSPIDNETISVTENPGAKITTVLLNGDNYLSRSQSATFWLKIRSNFGYVDSTIKAPSQEDPAYGSGRLIFIW